MDLESAQNWLNRYVAAWLSYDPDDVSALFSEDVAYRYHPYDEPIVGRVAVVASWLGEDASDDASTRDAPGTYEAEYSPVAVGIRPCRVSRLTLARSMFAFAAPTDSEFWQVRPNVPRKVRAVKERRAR
jgi:hypothetical protein